MVVFQPQQGQFLRLPIYVVGLNGSLLAFLAIAGEVLEFNEALESDPELVNSDPYGEGWMIKVKISDASELENLLSDEAYSNLIQ